MKPKHVAVLIGIGTAAVAVEAFYERPTFGRGIQALLACLGLRGLF